MVVNKLSFISSSQRLTGSWLNAVQGSVRFDGVERSDLFEEPDQFDEAGWLVNQRDPLLDWEHNPDTTIGNIGWGGRVISSDGESFGPPTTTIINGLYYIWVYGGRFQTVDRQIVEWATQLVEVDAGTTQFIFLDPITSTVIASTAEPTDQQVSLARITLDNIGEISNYEDLRSTSFTVDFSNRTKSLLFLNPEQNSNHILQDWERVLCDTSAGSIYVDLPESPADNTEVSIVDSEGYFHLYPVFLRPAPNGDNIEGVTVNGIDNDAFALDRRYGVYTLVYSQEKNGWFFIQNQEEKTYQRGTFITCGGRIPSETITDCVSGTSPTLFLDEEDKPVWEKVDGKCHLLYPKTSGIYSNPSLTDSQGLQVVHMDGRCRDEPHSYVSGGNTGFSTQESLIRRTTSQSILSQWNPSGGGGILDDLTPLPVGERDVLFELLNRVSYALLVGSWLHVLELEDNLPLLVSLTKRTTWYNSVLTLIDPILVSEFQTNLSFMLS